MSRKLHKCIVSVLTLRAIRTAGYGLAFIGAAVLPQSCAGQISVVRSNSFEVGGFVGATYGVDKYRPMGGGNLTYAINKIVLPYVEYSYFPGIARTVSQAVPGLPDTIASNTFSASFADFHGGVHIRIPIRESPVVPYLVVGVGALHNFQQPVDLTFTGVDGLLHRFPTTDPARTVFAANFGGGLRFYLGQRFGLRAEAKAYLPNSTITKAFGKVEAGFFVQLR
jgi:hypothetical protein